MARRKRYERNAGAKLLATVDSYYSAEGFLGGRTERKIANNTWVRYYAPGAIQVVLHRTPIVTFFDNNAIKLDSGGYLTATTKARMNALLSPPLRIFQSKYDWFVQLGPGRDDFDEFFDGMVLAPSGADRWRVAHTEYGNPCRSRRASRSVRGVSHRRNPAIDPATLGDIVWHMSMDGVDEEDSEENIGWMGLMRNIMHHEVLDAAEDAGHSKREARQALREVPDPFHAVLTEDSQGFRDVYPYAELEEAEDHFDTADEWFGREEYEEDED